MCVCVSIRIVFIVVKSMQYLIYVIFDRHHNRCRCHCRWASVLILNSIRRRNFNFYFVGRISFDVTHGAYA